MDFPISREHLMHLASMLNCKRRWSYTVKCINISTTKYWIKRANTNKMVSIFNIKRTTKHTISFVSSNFIIFMSTSLNTKEWDYIYIYIYLDMSGFIRTILILLKFKAPIMNQISRNCLYLYSKLLKDLIYLQGYSEHTYMYNIY